MQDQHHQSRNDDQPVQGIDPDDGIPQSARIDLRQDHTDHHHGHGQIAAPDGLHRGENDRRDLRAGQHQEHSDHTGDDTGMGRYLFYSSPDVRLFCKNGDPLRPHHGAHRDQKNAGQHQTSGAEDPFCHRAPQETGIGADDTVAQAFFPVFSLPGKKYLPVDDRDDLDHQRDQEDLQRRCHGIPGKLRKEARDNVTGKDQIDHEIRDIFLSLPADDLLFFEKKAQRHQDKDGRLQHQHSRHVLPLVLSDRH